MFVYKPYNISMKSKSDFTRRNAQRLGLCSELKKKRQQPESRLLAWFLAQRVGFEPTVPLPVHLISRVVKQPKPPCISAYLLIGYLRKAL